MLTPLLGVAVVFALARSRAPSATDLLARTRNYDYAHHATPVPLSQIATAVREAAVATARAFRDGPLVVHPHAQAGLCETQRSGNAGNTGSDDRDVDRAFVPRR